jgi:hypothetical protein
MDEDATTNQTKRCLVEVEGPLEEFPCTDPSIEHGLLEKIEGKFGRRQKKVPKVWGNAKSTPDSIAKKWFLNMQIARSAWFW